MKGYRATTPDYIADDASANKYGANQESAYTALDMYIDYIYKFRQSSTE